MIKSNIIKQNLLNYTQEQLAEIIIEAYESSDPTDYIETLVDSFEDVPDELGTEADDSDTIDESYW
jgi:hypothetical protein